MTHGSLFSGIGGFDLAAEWMGWENVFHCEWNDFGQKVLHHYWPKAISYHDITKTDFTIHRGTIDILTGGFPCQPYSMAGKRKGKEDERHLWPEMLRAIKEIQPRWVVGENVYGLVNWSNGLVFHEVQADLEAQGYEVFPYVLPACAVNAPHRRDRIWFVAYCKYNRLEHTIQRGAKSGISEKKTRRRKNGLSEFIQSVTSNGIREHVPHPNRNGLNGSDCQHEEQPSERGEYAQRDFEQMGKHNVNNPNSIGRSTVRDERRNFDDSKREWKFSPTNSTSDWWGNFPTQSPICTGDDGLSSRLDGITFSKWRNESIKAAGNAIVPQVALQIFKTIQQYETLPRMAAALQHRTL